MMSRFREIRTLIISLSLVFSAFAVSSYFCSQLFTTLRDSRYSNYGGWTSRRVKEILNYLEKADPQQNNRRILIFGSSELTLGIRAREIEDRLKKENLNFEILNLSIFNIDAEGTSIFIRRLEDFPLGKKPPLKTALISFQPTRLTKRYALFKHRRAETASMVHDLFTNEILYEYFSKSPANAIRVFFTKNIFGSITPIEARDYISRFMLSELSQVFSDTTNLDNFTQLALDVWNFDTMGIPGFDIETRGHFYFDLPYVPAELSERMQDYYKPEIRKMLRFSQNQYWDTRNFVPSPDLVQQYIENVKRLQKLFERVIVLYLPSAPDFGTSAAGTDNVQKMLDDIINATKAEKIDLSEKKIFDYKDYFDFIHLNRNGQTKMTSYLVDYFKENP